MTDAVSLGFQSAETGKEIYKRCKTYHHADEEVRQAILEIDSYWFTIEDQVRFLRDHWEFFDDRYQVHSNNLLGELQRNLQAAVDLIDNVLGEPEDSSVWTEIRSKKGDTRRGKWTVYTKKQLNLILGKIEKWHHRFDPTWFLLSRMSDKNVGRDFENSRDGDSGAISTVAKLREAHGESQTTLVSSISSSASSSSSLFLGKDYELRDIKVIPLAHSSMGLTSEGRRVIIDHYFLRNGVDFRTAKKDVRDLASILSRVDPAFSSLLPCKGVVETGSEPPFQMIFTIPRTMSRYVPCSLRSALLRTKDDFDLNERVHLAVSLARSVVFLHASRIVHKNITPENIVLLRSENETLGTPFLVGFERFRFDERRTNMTGDDNWERNIYRHPQRQGLQPEEVYSMRHDIYSVGVCLLEIGLWTSFVKYSDDLQVSGPDSDLPIDALLTAKNKRRAAVEIKALLIEKAMTHLPRTMGKIYTDVVVSCLTCLDNDSPLFRKPSDFEDDDGIVVGVRYIEKVGQILRTIGVKGG
ncbi:uncharacterized protein N7469_004166 [Penicillium citrinum]|uniref:Protein kinase domain-containing protein n=1 Tax=Penicillium citrinum TaxID=5077 RepID=A0A9W9TQZ1_PENCI|nr:uncharacterized protein N7469_004166 [Penicillium citrinum]KAJ5234998.1 hypothetical protein N7469_004166 [Penicillium citrinum]